MVIEVREICRRRGDQWKTKEDHKDNHNIHHHRTSHHCQLHFYQEPVSLAVLSRVILNPIMWELIRDSQSGLTSREFQNANQAARLGHLSLLQHMDAVNNVHFSSTVHSSSPKMAHFHTVLTVSNESIPEFEPCGCWRKHSSKVISKSVRLRDLACASILRQECTLTTQFYNHMSLALIRCCICIIRW
eukprot:514772_1